MLSTDIIKAIHNNKYEELIALSNLPDFKECINAPYMYDKDKKMYPLWALKKDNELFDKRILHLLAENDVILDFTNEYGQTLLMYCIERGYIHLSKALIEYDCDLNVQDNAGMTALHYAIYNLDVELTNLLLMCDTDKTLKDNCGQTAYYYLMHNTCHQHIQQASRKKEECIRLFQLYTE